MAQSKLELLLELKNHLSTGFTKANAYVNTQMSGLSAKVSQFSVANTKAFSAIQDEVPGAARAIGLLTNPYVLAASAAVGFGLATAKAVGMALDWEKSMAEINVTAQLTRPELKQLSNQILEIGSRGSTDLMEVPKAFNRIISAGLDVNTSLQVLGPTLKAAKAGFTDVETVAGAATSLMTSSGENVNRVYDIMFATLNKGNAKFQDIANYLPKIIPGAKNAGFALSEVGGAFAFLTAHGQTAEYATTGLMNTFKAFSKPETIKGFKSIGLDIFDAHRNVKPLKQLMTELSGLLSKEPNKESFINKFSQIGLDQDAVAAVATMIQNVDSLKGTLDFTGNSAGQLELAVANARTATDGWAEGWNKVKANMIAFGDKFLPLIEATGNFFNWLSGPKTTNNFLEDFKANQAEIKNLVAQKEGASPKMREMIDAKIKDLMGGDGWFHMSTAKEKLDWSFRKDYDEMSAEINRTTKEFKSADNLDDHNAAQAKLKDLYTKRDELQGQYLAYRSGKLDSPSLSPAGTLAAGATDSTAMAGASTSAATIGGATPNKSITINLEALQKGNTFNLKMPGDTGDGMSLDAFEKNLNEIFLRLLRNTSQAY